MMATVDDVLRVAAGEIGYYAPDDPLPGTKYGRWLAEKTGESWLAGPSTSIWWCAIFVSWVMAQAGVDGAGILPAVNCNVIRDRARKAGRWASKGEARSGDLVLFDWDGDGSLQHVGIVERNMGGWLQTIEGNTSSGVAGSQSAGNGVHRRTRAWGVVAGVVHMPLGSSVWSAGGLEVDGMWGSATTRRLQEVLGAPYVDGCISRQPGRWRDRLPGCTSGWGWVGDAGVWPGSQTLRLVQSRIGVAVDGFVGPETINGLIGYYRGASGATVLDGRLDACSLTVKAMQRALNENRF